MCKGGSRFDIQVEVEGDRTCFGMVEEEREIFRWGIAGHDDVRPQLWHVQRNFSPEPVHSYNGEIEAMTIRASQVKYITNDLNREGVHALSF